MVRTILIGFDGSDQARDALALARLLGRASGARLVAACVYPPVTLLARPDLADWQAAVRKGAEDSLAAVGDDAVERRVIESQSAARGLHDAAEEIEADLVVVGSCHRSRLGRVLAGSVAERLLHGAPCAVALAPRGFADRAPTGLETIGVGFDGSPEAEVALAGATELARGAGAALRILCLIRPSDTIPAFASPLPVPVLAESLRWEAEQALERGLAAVPADVEAEGAIIGGATAALGEQGDIDLMVVGSRGYGPLRRVLLGSTSASLARNSAYPVIVLPRGDVSRTDSPPVESARSA